MPTTPQGLRYPAPSDLVSTGPAAFQALAEDVHTYARGGYAPVFAVDNALADNATDATAHIQSKIDAAFAAGGGTVFIPAGNYRAAGLVLKDHVHVIGAGTQATFIRPPAASTALGVFTLAPGPVIYITVADLNVRTDTTNVANGFYLQATAKADGTVGGLWYSTFRNVELTGFPGAGIWLRGGTTNFSLPNQFLRFENVVIFRKDDVAALALRSTGQLGQTVFIGCEFDGPTVNGAGINVSIGREFQADGVTPVGSRTGYVINFLGCTFQGAELAVYIDTAVSVQLNGCYFENNKNGIDCDTNSIVKILDCQWSNSASDGVGTGYGIRARRAARVRTDGGYFAGTTDRAYFLDTANATTTLNQGLTHSPSDADVVPTAGRMTRQLAAAPTLNLGPHRTALIDTGESITKINSHYGEGHSVHLRTNVGATVTYTASADLDLGGRASPLTVAPGVVASFTKFDRGSNWTLTALSA